MADRFPTASKAVWVRPDAIGSPSPMRRTASASAVAPRLTSEASWGQVEIDLSTSTSDAATREESRSASR